MQNSDEKAIFVFHSGLVDLLIVLAFSRGGAP